MNANTEQKILWTVKEAAEKLSMSARSVERLIEGQKIPFVRIGRSVRIPAVDAIEWVAEKVCGVDNASHARRDVPKKRGDKSTCQRSVIQMGCLSEETRNFGGSVTSMQAANELAEVLGLPTEKKPKRF